MKNKWKESIYIMQNDSINRQKTIDKFESWLKVDGYSEGELNMLKAVLYELRLMPPAKKIVQCKDCQYWRRQTNYQGVPLSFGFCESEDMWVSLYGETYEVAHIDTDEDFYCGYAKRREV